MGDLREQLRASTQGEGPTLLLIHGSAVDQNTWSLQRRLLHGARKILYDRRGTHGAGGVEGQTPVSLSQHAADAAELIRLFSPQAPVVACGSSFGAVVVLELLRTHPQLLRHAVLLEPPLSWADGVDVAPREFLAHFDTLVQKQGGSAAGAFFLRSVLGEEAFEQMPLRFREKSSSYWEEIRRDCLALGEYRVDYPSLAAITTPVSLIGGERSAGLYGKTLHALEDALGNATLEFLPAGHMMHAEAHRRFNARLMEVLEQGAS